MRCLGKGAVESWLAILGALLMLFTPLLPVVYNGPACLTGFSCAVINNAGTSNIILGLTIFSGVGSFVVALIVRFADTRRYPLLGGLIVVLSLQYWFAIGMSFELSLLTFPSTSGALTISAIGPTLTLISGLMLVRTR